jgi:hypothetical protein
MRQNNTLAQLARRITKADTVLRDPQLFHPAREWRIGLIVAMLIFIASAIWSMQTYTFFRDASVVQEVTAVTEEVTVYRESLVEAALTAYEERAAAHTLLLQKVQVTPATTTPVTEGGQTEGQQSDGKTEDEQSTSDNSLLETEISSTTGGDIE